VVAGVAAGIVFAIDKLAGVCQKMRSMPMPRIGLALVGVCFLLTGVASAAAPLSSATVTEMKNDVRLRAATTEEHSAKLRDTIAGADVLRTGERSLAEVEFNDKTLTRLGSKSVFSFEPANREFRVDKGLALICMPKGAGGGRVVTAAITAAIEGTTVLALGSGKIIFLEGTGIVISHDGKQSKPITGGQIAVIEDGLLKVYDVYVTPLLQSRFIKSRPARLPTWDAVQQMAQQQEDDLKHGRKAPAKAGTAAGAPGVNDPPWRDEGMIGIILQQPRGTKPPQP
jgi:hypothetical protein